jgi:4-diphosphocytidyl-2-C-methyl-D-erythritol kinase
MRPLAAHAPAKINLCLFLGPPRSDGRHELVSVMQSVSLADEVRLLPAAEGVASDEVFCPRVRGPNLAGAALAAFRERTGWDAPPLRIEIDKRIPVAGGMAGGSTDAAAVLRLAAAAHGDVQESVLLELAAGLGSDVPAQLRPGRVLTEGAGERVQALPDAPAFGVLVIALDAALSTAAVYAEADELELCRGEAELERLLEQVREGVGADSEPLARPLMVNDLEHAAISLAPAIRAARERARDGGADIVMVSGSGPTVLGIFLGEDGFKRAHRAVERVAGTGPLVIAVQPVGAEFGEPRPIEAA